MLFRVTFEPRPDLGATHEDLANLYHAYCGSWVAELLGAFPQRFMLGMPPDGA